MYLLNLKDFEKGLKNSVLRAEQNQGVGSSSSEEKRLLTNLVLFLFPNTLLFLSRIFWRNKMEWHVLVLVLSLPSVSWADCSEQCLKCALQVSDSPLNLLVRSCCCARGTNLLLSWEPSGGGGGVKQSN